MATFTVSYDLVKDRNYQPLWDELARLGAHRTQDSYWLASVNISTAKELHDHLKAFMDSDDRLWVVELVKNRYYSNAMKGTNDWLAENPPAR